MLFLVEYDRRKGRLLTFKAFRDLDRHTAEDARIELEVSLNRRGIDREVVLLEAASEATLRRTHRRYFEDLAAIAKTPRSR
jgi:hypothetical protein